MSNEEVLKEVNARIAARGWNASAEVFDHTADSGAKYVVVNLTFLGGAYHSGAASRKDRQNPDFINDLFLDAEHNAKEQGVDLRAAVDLISGGK